ncbi:uncharacterized protein KQ657_001309 [Scheffersomyces spartinae]|uniref:FHA domain-containing protein n=1 Tax=Scheffersomyces spartinae TaxID=45513 RepID=A0A9P8AHU0_9ASCO|nr:uncharacterized protein KQ657_001309 [Scheffersomyces spartinae]KAG7192852.1 hypothetical protein KQ657_001309 [Scheffersomyces spartinae]
MPTGIGSHGHLVNIQEDGLETIMSDTSPLGRRDSFEACNGVVTDNTSNESSSDESNITPGHLNNGYGNYNGINSGLNITGQRNTKNTSSSAEAAAVPPISTTTPSNSVRAKEKPSSGSSKVASNSQVLHEGSSKEGKRTACEYMVTLVLLNDTFVKKQLHVPYYPETMKLGRPIGAKIKPDVNNGYFDSRVLSRNHADLYIDPTTGDLMLKDLNSSNGTFVNDVKLGAEPVALQIGDTVHLGFNIQAESNHKQISVRVENINIITNYMGNNMMWNDKRSKHVEYVRNIYNQLCTMEKEETPEEVVESFSSSKRMVTFDNALFGDINPKFEDNLLGLFNKNGAGFFNNSQIINNTALEGVLNILTLSLSEVRQQNNTLKSLESYIRKYLTQTDILVQRHIDDITNRKFHEMDISFNKERQHHRSMKLEYKHYKEEAEGKIDILKNENIELSNEVGELKDTILMLQQMMSSSSKSSSEKEKTKEGETVTEINSESNFNIPRDTLTAATDPVECLDTLAAQLSEVIEKPKDVDDDDIEVHQLEHLLNSSEALEDRDDCIAKEVEQTRSLTSTPPQSASSSSSITGTTSRTHAAVLGISAVLISVLIHRLSQ